jgi:hypothetical protein
MSSFIYVLVTAYWWQTAKVGDGIISANRQHGIGSWANPSQDSPVNSGILHWHWAAAAGMTLSDAYREAYQCENMSGAAIRNEASKLAANHDVAMMAAVEG